MKRNRKNRKNRTLLIVASLSFALVAGLSIAMMSDAYAGETKWNIVFDKTSGNSALGQTAYRSMQGIGYDTYTGSDGYVFMESDDKKTYMLSQFTMEDSGFCTKVKKVKYNATNVGHANDITIYKDENGTKWLIFAPCGTYGEDNKAKASNGSAVNLGAIKLSEYNSGTAKIYSCNVNAVRELFPNFNKGDKSNKGNITGVTYMGKDYIDEHVVPVFAIMNAKEIYKTYLTIENGALVFKPAGVSGRINKPKLPSGAEADTQGIVYHNNYIYITGEGKENTAAQLAVARISLETLFDGDRQTLKDMEVYKDNKKSDTVSKHGPEGAFFTSLNDKSHLYIGVNRQVSGKDDDQIMRTPARY